MLHTDAVRAGSWEKFTLVDSGDGSSTIRYGIQTKTGNYLTAVGGGGRTTDVMHSDATQLQSWEKLTLISLGGGTYAIQTIDGHYLTAVGGGGRITDTIHSDATRIGSWEKFQVACNRVGSRAGSTGPGRTPGTRRRCLDGAFWVGGHEDPRARRTTAASG